MGTYEVSKTFVSEALGPTDLNNIELNVKRAFNSQYITPDFEALNIGGAAVVSNSRQLYGTSLTLSSTANISGGANITGGTLTSTTGTSLVLTSPTILSGTYTAGTFTNPTLSNPAGQKVAIGLRLDAVAYTGTNIAGALLPYAMTINGVRVHSDATVSGSSLTIDLNKNGNSILTGAFSGKCVITTSGTTGAVTGMTESCAIGDRISYDIDTVGSTTAGGNMLYVTVYGVTA